MRILRVFPRRTRGTPDDDLVRVGCGPGLFDEADEVHVSVTFTWDIPLAEKLARQWEPVAPVKVGGPALGDRGGEFTPGLYLRKGYTITSRGCPNHCWYCHVPRREGGVRELEAKDGWIVQDNNLLACSDEHLAKVWKMLARQPHRAQFTGGLEAARLTRAHAAMLQQIRPEQIFLAYDSPGDRAAVAAALELLRVSGFDRHQLRVYVLCGHAADSLEAADIRMREVVALGAFPMAMLFERRPDPEWRKFQKLWARPALIYALIKQATA